MKYIFIALLFLGGCSTPSVQAEPRVSELNRSVFKICGKPVKGRSFCGTSFIVKRGNDPFILTNAHICTTIRAINVYEPNAPRQIASDLEIIYDYYNRAKATVLKVDYINDLCLLSIDLIPTDYIALKLAKKGPKYADVVYTFTVNGLRKDIGLKDLYQGNYIGLDPSRIRHKNSHRMRLFSRSGMSGSPILNSKGELIMILWGSGNFNKDGTVRYFQDNGKILTYAAGYKALLHFLEID